VGCHAFGNTWPLDRRQKPIVCPTFLLPPCHPFQPANHGSPGPPLDSEGCTIGSVGVENLNPHEELLKLDRQIQAATDLAALKPLYFRLNEIMQAYPGDFDVQFTGNDVKQHLMTRGRLLKMQETAPPPPPSAMPVMPPPPLPTDWPDAAPPPGAPPEPPVLPVAPQTAPPVPLPFPLFDAAPPGEAPPAFAVSPVYPPQPPARPPAPPPPPRPVFRRNPAAAIVSIAGLLVLLVLGFWWGRKIGTRPADSSVNVVEVAISTTPTGASVKVAGGNNPVACTSNCKLALAPGTYQVSASLDGFETAIGAVTVSGHRPAELSLTLQPQVPSVRLLTDLAQGKVVLDDRLPVDLEEGQFVLDKVASGTHTVTVTGPNESASFSFEIADARLPVVSGPISARNMLAVVVASRGKQARLVTNAGPWKLAVNGQPQSDASPAGTDLTAFQPGINEIVLGEGRDQRNMSEAFGAAPMLTAFLKTDVDAGTVIVSTGQDEVRVYLNDKEYRRRTERGQLRVQALGKVTVRVAKTGFEDAPPQTVEVKKGAEVRLQFDLKPLPKFGSLAIQGAMPGTEVFIDQRNRGAAAPDGSVTIGEVQPGDHAIELRREQYAPKRLQRSFRAGQAVVLAGADVALAAATGVVHFIRTPASATVTYRRGDETEAHEARGNQIELPPGSYLFAAAAPGFADVSIRVPLAAGESHDVTFTLAPRPTPPPIAVRGMADFAEPQSWKKEGDDWVHTGGGFVPYKLPPKGIFTFTVERLKGGAFRAGQIRWCVQYLDPKNYLLFEMDRKNFWAGVIEKGKRYERVKTPENLGNQKAFTIQVEVAPDRLTQRVRAGNDWKVLDTFSEPGRDFTQGKFGFLIQGNDEIAISDFKFVPK